LRKSPAGRLSTLAGAPRPKKLAPASADWKETMPDTASKPDSNELLTNKDITLLMMCPYVDLSGSCSDGDSDRHERCHCIHPRYSLLMPLAEPFAYRH
jgi:hypothetical protein